MHHTSSQHVFIMKFFIAFTAVILAVAALPAPFPQLPDIGADNLQLANNGSRVYAPRNAGLAGFAAGCIGGAGGAVWTVWDAWALRDSLNSVSPRIIYVRGRIDLTTLFTGSPGVNVMVGPFKTIIGGDANAEITGGGLYMQNQVHVIIQNIKFSNAISYAPGEQPNGNGGIVGQVPGAWSQIDCVDMNFSEFIWVDHCEFSDDPWIAANIAENSRRHNGLVTVKQTTSYVTISNNIFRNHNMNLLIGHDDSNTQDSGRLKVTLYLNWFLGTTQRNPMVRYGEVHVLNNLYTDISSYGIGVHTGAQVYAERNSFINTARAWANPIWNQPAANSHLLNDGNLLSNSNFDSGMSSNVVWRPSNHYGYSPMIASNVEWHVRTYSGTW